MVDGTWCKHRRVRRYVKETPRYVKEMCKNEEENNIQREGNL